MNRFVTLVLQLGVVLVGCTALLFLLIEPHFEGRNINATAYEVYFNDPFLVYAYVASISLFLLLYQVFRVIGYIGKKQTYSFAVVKALRTIQYCALAGIGFVVGPLVYLLVVRPEDDIAGGVAMGLLIIICFAISGTIATMFKKVIQSNI